MSPRVLSSSDSEALDGDRIQRAWLGGTTEHLALSLPLARHAEDPAAVWGVRSVFRAGR